MSRRATLIAIGTTSTAMLSGCSGGASSDPTATPTPPPKTGAIPYTASDPGENVALVRDLRIWNNTDRDQSILISITDTETGTEFYRRTVTIESSTKPRFRDLIAKQGRYKIRFELDVGVRKTFEWPVDDAHGNARAVVGGDPVNPTITFRIQPL